MIAQLASEYGQHCTTWCDIVHTVTDPAHLIAELVFNIVFDGLILFLLWGKIIRPRLFKQIHKEIDTEHGVEHTDYVKFDILNNSEDTLRKADHSRAHAEHLRFQVTPPRKDPHAL